MPENDDIRRRNRISQKDIAVAAGVTRATVSMALRNDTKISVATRERIKSISAELGYESNPAISNVMSALRTGSDRTNFHSLGVIYGAALDPKKNPVLAGVMERSRELGISVDVIRIQFGTMSSDKLLKLVENRNFDALILMGRSEWEPEILEAIHGELSRLPIVWTSVPLGDMKIPSCSIDHFGTAQMAVRRALSAGRERLVMIVPAVIPSMVLERFEGGFITALRTAGAAEISVFRSNNFPGQMPSSELENARKLKQYLEENRVDTVLSLLTDFRPFLNEAGIAVPEKISLIELDLHSSDLGKLAGLHQRHGIVGSVAADLIMRQIRRHENLANHTIPSCVLMPEWSSGPTLPE